MNLCASLLISFYLFLEPVRRKKVLKDLHHPPFSLDVVNDEVRFQVESQDPKSGLELTVGPKTLVSTLSSDEFMSLCLYVLIISPSIVNQSFLCLKLSL